MNDIEASPVEAAARIIGSRVALARLLGVTKGAVWQWEHATRVPAEHCPVIERITKGAVRCEDLRPDVDWGYLRGTAPAGAHPEAGTESALPAEVMPHESGFAPPLLAPAVRNDDVEAA